MRHRATWAGLYGLVLFTPAINACSSKDRYELHQDKEGRTFRLDRRTGEIAVVTATGVHSLTTDAQRAIEEKKQSDRRASLARPRYWPLDSIPQLKVRSTILATVYRDGSLHYQLLIRPIPKGYPGYSTEPFSLTFADSAGFTIASHPLPSSDLTRNLDNAGKASGLSTAGAIVMTADQYEGIAAYQLTWRF